MVTDVCAILDRLAPHERGLPPSLRKWARLVETFDTVAPVLQLRLPPTQGDGELGDYLHATRRQYCSARNALWMRDLPPGEDPETAQGKLEVPLRGIVKWVRASLKDVDENVAIWSGIVAEAPARPHRCPGYGSLVMAMPPQDPLDIWCDITEVPCPAPSCSGILVWYEAGFVPGYRVCMQLDGHAQDRQEYDSATILHHWVPERQRLQEEVPGSEMDPQKVAGVAFLMKLVKTLR